MDGAGALNAYGAEDPAHRAWRSLRSPVFISLRAVRGVAQSGSAPALGAPLFLEWDTFRDVEGNEALVEALRGG